MKSIGDVDVAANCPDGGDEEIPGGRAQSLSIVT